jgi:hypothetical protein
MSHDLHSIKGSGLAQRLGRAFKAQFGVPPSIARKVKE